MVIKMQHNVVRLKVPVNQSLLIKVQEALNKLLDNIMDLALPKIASHLDQLVQVCTIAVVHNNISRTMSRYYIVDADKILMLQLHERLHLLDHILELRLVLLRIESVDLLRAEHRILLHLVLAYVGAALRTGAELLVELVLADRLHLLLRFLFFDWHGGHVRGPIEINLVTLIELHFARLRLVATKLHALLPVFRGVECVSLLLVML